jgi:hypothetical protein
VRNKANWRRQRTGAPGRTDAPRPAVCGRGRAGTPNPRSGRGQALRRNAWRTSASSVEPRHYERAGKPIVRNKANCSRATREADTWLKKNRDAWDTHMAAAKQSQLMEASAMRQLIWTPASAGVTRGKGLGVQTKPIWSSPAGVRGARCAKQTQFRAPMARARGPFVRNEANVHYYADPEIGVPGGRVRQTKPKGSGQSLVDGGQSYKQTQFPAWQQRAECAKRTQFQRMSTGWPDAAVRGTHPTALRLHGNIERLRLRGSFRAAAADGVAKQRLTSDATDTDRKSVV